jgi:hypothetical protein
MPSRVAGSMDDPPRTRKVDGELSTRLFALIAVLALAGCGGAAAATSPTPTGAPTIAPTAVPTIAATAAPTAVPTAVQTAAPTPIPAPTVPGGDLASAIDEFAAVHPRYVGPGVICHAENSCFGPTLVNDESGPNLSPEFGDVSVDAGIVDGYTMNFATGTTIAEAKAEVLAWLPRDTVTTYYAINHTNGSCAMWNVRSKTLGLVLGAPSIGDPQGDLGITLGYVDANFDNVYESTNIEHADIDVAPDDPSDGC